jgi:hypothetical protein
MTFALGNGSRVSRSITRPVIFPLAPSADAAARSVMSTTVVREEKSCWDERRRFMPNPLWNDELQCVNHFDNRQLLIVVRYSPRKSGLTLVNNEYRMTNSE